MLTKDEKLTSSREYDEKSYWKYPESCNRSSRSNVQRFACYFILRFFSKKKKMDSFAFTMRFSLGFCKMTSAVFYE